MRAGGQARARAARARGCSHLRRLLRRPLPGRSSASGPAPRTDNEVGRRAHRGLPQPVMSKPSQHPQVQVAQSATAPCARISTRERPFALSAAPKTRQWEKPVAGAAGVCWPPEVRQPALPVPRALPEPPATATFTSRSRYSPYYRLSTSRTVPSVRRREGQTGARSRSSPPRTCRAMRSAVLPPMAQTPIETTCGAEEHARVSARVLLSAVGTR